jgi:hypothetical protein
MCDQIFAPLAEFLHSPSRQGVETATAKVQHHPGKFAIERLMVGMVCIPRLNIFNQLVRFVDESGKLIVWVHAGFETSMGYFTVFEKVKRSRHCNKFGKMWWVG